VINCELLYNACQTHVEQIHTGFVELHRRGFVRLKLSKLRRPRRWTGLLVRVNDDVLVYYDMNDDALLYEEMLDEVHFYFKRSFLPSHREKSLKIHPLGLNFPLSTEGFDLFRLRRELSVGSLKDRAKGVLRRIFKDYPSGRQIEAPPIFDGPPRILLLTKSWAHRFSADICARDNLQALDANRAECIRALRREFGDLFLGGMADCPAARQRFGDVVVSDPRITRKAAYLKLLREFPICVTTMGLWKSNGWRLAEYVAQSKAIVSERLEYHVPGGFDDGVNYLSFTSPEECVAAARRLVEDRELRIRISMNNYHYYRAFLRADSLIMNTLAIALGGQ
jgi:hypothetical protein